MNKLSSVTLSNLKERILDLMPLPIVNVSVKADYIIDHLYQINLSGIHTTYNFKDDIYEHHLVIVDIIYNRKTDELHTESSRIISNDRIIGKL